MIDTHCHLDWDSYEGELDAVLQRSRDAGVLAFVTIGTDMDRNEKARLVVEKYEDVYQCVGFHPDVVVREDFDGAMMREWLKSLDKDMRGAKVVGIGEIGLDYYVLSEMTEKDRIRKIELQKELFERQIILAKREGLPVSLHVRDHREDAYWDTLEILGEYYDTHGDAFVAEFAYSELEDQYEHGGDGVGAKATVKSKPAGVLHCVSGPLEYLEKAVELGFYLGVCGNVTFKNAGELRANLSVLPLERMVLETDAPFLAPEPYRGKRNESAYMIETAKKLAQIKGVSLEEVQRVTSENACSLWGITKMEK